MTGFENSTQPWRVFYENLAKCYQTWQLALVGAEANEVDSAGVNRRKFHIVTWARSVIEVSVTCVNSVVTEVIHDH